MSTPTINKALHEIVILAAGRAATRDELDLMLSLEGNGNWAPLINVINSFMGGLADASGSSAIVKLMASNGMGISMSDADAEAQALAIDSGEVTWADYFVEKIFNEDETGVVLTNRAEAAYDFTIKMAAVDKASFYTGSSVVGSVTNLIQGVTGIAASVTKAIAGLDALVDALSAEGIAGKVVDGYISGGSVGVDTDGDGVLSADEILSTTDEQGNFTLSADSGSGKIIAFGGIDIMTGKAFAGTLTASAGSTIINPVTTILQAVIDSGESVFNANSIVEKALGLPEGANPNSYNPLAVLSSLTSTAEEKSSALASQSKALQISNIIAQSSAAIKSGAGDATQAVAAKAVTTAIAGKIVESATLNEEIDLTDIDTLTNIIETAATEAGETEVAAQSSKLASIASSSNSAAKNAATINDLAKVAVVSQGSAVTDIETSITAEEDLEAIVESYSAENIAAAVEAAEAGTIFQTPTFGAQVANAGSKTLTLTTSETVTGEPAVGDFAVTANNVSNPVTAVSVSGTTVTLTLTNFIANSATVTVGYTKSGTASAQIKDAAGNAVATLSSAINIEINDNEAPLLTVPPASSLVEDDANESVSGTLIATDPEGDLLRYELIGGTLTSGAYTSTGTYGTLSLNSTTGAYNYVLNNNAVATNVLGSSDTGEDNFNVRVSDNINLSSENLLTFNIAGANDAPTNLALNSTSVIENSQGEIVGVLSASDVEGDSLTFTVGGSDGSFFTIDGTTLKLESSYSADRETQASFNIDIGVTDGVSIAKQTFTIDVIDDVLPVVSEVSSTLADGSYNVGDVIPITVAFSEAVIVSTSSGTPTLALETGDTDRTASYVSGSGTDTLVFNYTVQSGDTSSDLSYTGSTALTLNSGTIQDAAGNNATLTLAAAAAEGSLSNNKALVIDGGAPTFGAQEADAGSKTVTLTTSETVTGEPAVGDFAVTVNNVSNPVTEVLVSGTTVTLTLTNFIANSATVTVGYTKSGTASAQIKDAAGNAVATLGSAASVTVSNDSVVPTVSGGVSSTLADGSYNVGDVIPITVAFSEAVIVSTSSGTPTLALETGDTDRTASYVSGSGTDTLVFNYTVQSGDTSSDLSYTGSTALTLNSGTIQDAAGNNATLTLAAAAAEGSLSNNKALVIDGGAPTFGAQEADAGSKTVTLTTSETVTGEPAVGDFAVTVNNVSNPVTEVLVSGTTVTLTLTNFIANSATVTVGYTKSGTASAQIKDAAGNAVATLGSAASVTVSNDSVVPTVSGGVSSTLVDGSYNVGDVIPITVAFSEAVIVSTSSGTPTLALETGDTDRTASYVSGSGTDTLVFNYTVQSGDTSSDLSYTGSTALTLNSGTIQDAAGNNATLTLAAAAAEGSLSNNKALVIDGGAPTFGAQEADAGSKTVTLTTSETVTGEPAVGDFAVTVNNVSNPVTEVLVSGTTVTLTLTNFIANSATVTVGYTKSGTASAQIKDAAGNAVATLGSAASVTVSNDSVVPTVSGGVSSTLVDGSYNVGDVIPITVAFSEAVIVSTSSGTPTLALETGDTDRTASYVSGSGTDTLVFNYTVQSGDTSSDLSYTGSTALTLNSGTIQDAAGNNATLTLAAAAAEGSLSNNKALVIDGGAPTFGAQEADAGSKTVTLTTSETVTGEPAVGDFAVTVNNVSNPVTEVLVSGTTVTLTLTNFIANSATVTVGYTKSGTASAQIKDAAGNAVATLGSAASVTVSNDSVVPTVSGGVSSTLVDGSYNVGDVIPITVAFSEAVIVSTSSGTPTLALETGDTDRTASYVSGSGTDTLVFNYTVQSGDTSSDLSYTGSTALTLNSGTIQDAAGNNATLTLAAAAAEGSLSNNKALVIDGITPSFLNDSGSTSPTNSEALSQSDGLFPNIILDFSESIQLVSGASLAANITITTPLGPDDKLVNFTAQISGGNLEINLDETDGDILAARSQQIYIDIAANTLQDAAGNNVIEVVGVTSYSILLSV